MTGGINAARTAAWMGLALALGVTWSGAAARGAERATGVQLVEFLYERAPFPECHASTLAETSTGLVAAWFGGEYEKHPSVGIWFARRGESGWSAPVEVATGVQADGKRLPCWNPVLYQTPGGPLWLFYKVGPSPSTWWGMVIQSTDGGQTWSKPTKLPEDIAGPIKNKPIALADGRLLCGSSTEDHGWRVHMEWTTNPLDKWSRTEPLNEGERIGAIQPTLLVHPQGALQMLCRSRGVAKILSARSTDGGRTWTELTPIDLPNPNSGIDGVTMKDGRHALVYNHTRKGRSPLNLALSADGQTWQAAVVLESEPGEYSYPAIIQTADGKLHISYTWKRQKVRHVVVDPGQLKLAAIVDGEWPR